MIEALGEVEGKELVASRFPSWSLLVSYQDTAGVAPLAK